MLRATAGNDLMSRNLAVLFAAGWRAGGKHHELYRAIWETQEKYANRHGTVDVELAAIHALSPT